jgi:hypothetical protein
LSREAKNWWVESKKETENITEWIDEQCSVVSQINPKIHSESDSNSSESINWYEFAMFFSISFWCSFFFSNRDKDGNPRLEDLGFAEKFW